jgi:hypothetical protein
VPQTAATQPGSSPAERAIEMNVSRMLYWPRARSLARRSVTNQIRRCNHSWESGWPVASVKT